MKNFLERANALRITIEKDDDDDVSLKNQKLDILYQLIRQSSRREVPNTFTFTLSSIQAEKIIRSIFEQLELKVHTISTSSTTHDVTVDDNA